MKKLLLIVALVSAAIASTYDRGAVPSGTYDRGAVPSSGAAGVTQYTLTPAVSGNGSMTPSSPTLVDSGVGTAIVATVTDSTRFVNWTVTAGAASIANSTNASTYCTLSVAGGATVQANFVPDSADVDTNLVSVPVGWGTLYIQPAKLRFKYGELCTARVALNSGYQCDSIGYSNGHIQYDTTTADTVIFTVYDAACVVNIWASEIPVGQQCVTLYTGTDTGRTWADAVSLTSTVTAANGAKIYLKVTSTTDTSTVLSLDSINVAANASPQVITDTSSTSLTASTSYAAWFVDTCRNRSDTVQFWTQDSLNPNDTTYLWTAKPVLTGISPSDSGYVGARIKIFGSEIKDTGSLAYYGKTCVLDSVNNDTIYAVVPDTTAGTHNMVWVDHYGKRDTIPFKLLEAAPDTFEITITENPGAAFTYSVLPARQESGLPCSLVITVASGYIGDNLTSDTSCSIAPIGSDTIIWPALSGNKSVTINGHARPQYTRDTIIVGGHATVAVVPATLTPVDSAAACTTSRVSVDEGWRCDSIKSNSTVVYYPATFIAYTIAQNRIDSIFISEIPVIPDSSTLTLSQTSGGTVSADPTATRRASGDQSIISAVPDLHYHFVRWLDDLSDSTGNPLTYIYSAMGTYTGSALFGPDTVPIFYDPNGGTGEPPASKLIGYGQTFAVANNTMTNPGYTFTGWNTAADGSGTDYAEGATYTGGVSSETLYAQWAFIPRQLTIDTTGSGSTDQAEGVPQMVPDGDSVLVVYMADIHNHYVSTSVTGGATARDTASGAQWIVISGADGTATINFGPDTHTVTLIDGDNVNLTAINGTSKPWGSVCSVAVRCSTGYAWRVEGGPWRRVQDTTLLITVISDTTITAESYLIPTDARSVVVTPASLTIDTGGTRQFTATYYDTIGRVADPQPVTTWAATVGSINGSGLFTAGTDTGTGIVRGYNGAIADTSAVRIRYKSSAVASRGARGSFRFGFRKSWR